MKPQLHPSPLTMTHQQLLTILASSLFSSGATGVLIGGGVSVVVDIGEGDFGAAATLPSTHGV